MDTSNIWVQLAVVAVIIFAAPGVLKKIGLSGSTLMVVAVVLGVLFVLAGDPLPLIAAIFGR